MLFFDDIIPKEHVGLFFENDVSAESPTPEDVLDYIMHDPKLKKLSHDEKIVKFYSILKDEGAFEDSDIYPWIKEHFKANEDYAAQLINEFNRYGTVKGKEIE